MPSNNVKVLSDHLPDFVMINDVLGLINRLFKESLNQSGVHYVLDCESVRDISGEALSALSTLRRFDLHPNGCDLTLRGCNERMTEVTTGPCFRGLMGLA
jgi:hypothetical protein